MCALLKSSIWKFSNPPVRSTYEAMLSPRNGDSLVMSSQNQTGNGSTDPIAKSVGQSFSIAFSEELQRKGLIAERVAMRTFIGTEELRSGRSRTRAEIDVIIEVPRATQNELIDALATAKRRCSAWVGPDIKILLKAELKTGRALELKSLKKSPR
jgi:hypothetical protein